MVQLYRRKQSEVMIIAITLAATIQAAPLREAPTSFAELGQLRGWFGACAAYGWRLDEQQLHRWQASLILNDIIAMPRGEDPIAVTEASTDQFKADLIRSFRASTASKVRLRSWADRIRTGCDGAAETFSSVLSRTEETDATWNQFIETVEGRIQP